MDKNNKNDRLTSRKDDMIGEFLSSMVNKEKANTKCPSLEDIAVFLDGKLNDMDRDAIMGHVSLGKCFHVSFVFHCGLSYVSDLFGLGGAV